MDGKRPAQATAALVVVEDRVETRSVSVEEQFAANWVEVSSTFGAVSEQRLGITFERRAPRVEPHSAHIDHNSFITTIIIIIIIIIVIIVLASYHVVVVVLIRVVLKARTCCDVIDCYVDVIGRCDVARR